MKDKKHTAERIESNERADDRRTRIQAHEAVEAERDERVERFLACVTPPEILIAPSLEAVDELLGQLPRAYEWDWVPGPDMVQ